MTTERLQYQIITLCLEFHHMVFLYMYAHEMEESCAMVNGGRWSTLHCYPTTCISLFLQCCPLKRLLAGNKFYCQISCDLKVANQSLCCWGKNPRYITKHSSCYICYLVWTIAETHGLYLDHRRGKLAAVREIECQNLLTHTKKRYSIGVQKNGKYSRFKSQRKEITCFCSPR